MNVSARDATCCAIKTVAPPADVKRRDAFFASGLPFFDADADAVSELIDAMCSDIVWSSRATRVEAIRLHLIQPHLCDDTERRNNRVEQYDGQIKVSLPKMPDV